MYLLILKKWKTIEESCYFIFSILNKSSKQVSDKEGVYTSLVNNILYYENHCGGEHGIVFQFDFNFLCIPCSFTEEFH